MENKAITIYDIAREAGVSPATVSRVLTNSANVRKEKKEKVQYLIDKYNFKPNALAKSLSDTKSKVIGIVVADVRNPFYAEVFVACEDAARKAGYTVLLCNSLGVLDREIQHFDMLQQYQVAGIIQLGGGVDDLVSNPEYVEKINRISPSIPIVAGGNLKVRNCYRVEIDANKAAELLLEYLIGLGHRKIALVGGRRDVTSTYEKYLAYRRILEKYEIEYREEYIVDGEYNCISGYEGMNQLFDRNEVPTAVVAINDFSAAGVMRSITEHHYRIPDDISVVSYDNTYFSDLLTPKLTSIDYDYSLFGQKLVDAAIAAIEGEEVPSLQKITPSLVLKESSGAVSNRKN